MLERVARVTPEQTLPAQTMPVAGTPAKPIFVYLK